MWGYNHYTLTARLGSGDLAHYETSSRLDPTVHAKEQDVEIKQDSSRLE